MAAVGARGSSASFATRAIAAAAAGALLLGWTALAKEPAGPPGPAFHQGEMLVASHRMRDPRFGQTVIILVEHNGKGAFGLVVNRLLAIDRMDNVLKNLGLGGEGASGNVRIHYGGPVELDHGFILHSPDYVRDGTRQVADGIAVTSAPDVLRDIALGKGPKRSVFALGYAGWGPGQLESELARKDWFTIPADQAIVFDETLEDKWDRAMAKRQVDL